MVFMNGTRGSGELGAILWLYCSIQLDKILKEQTDLGHAVAQLVEALRYKPEGRGFDSRWYH